LTSSVIFFFAMTAPITSPNQCPTPCSGVQLLHCVDDGGSRQSGSGQVWSHGGKPQSRVRGGKSRGPKSASVSSVSTLETVVKIETDTILRFGGFTLARSVGQPEADAQYSRAARPKIARAPARGEWSRTCTRARGNRRFHAILGGRFRLVDGLLRGSFGR
jgi:hypothetical protein